MSIAVECHRSRGMPEEPLHDLDVSARRDGERCRGVSEPMGNKTVDSDRVARLIERPPILAQWEVPAPAAWKHERVGTVRQLLGQPLPYRLRDGDVPRTSGLGRRLHDALTRNSRR
jgi:hypothetical protein